MPSTFTPETVLTALAMQQVAVYSAWNALHSRSRWHGKRFMAVTEPIAVAARREANAATRALFTAPFGHAIHLHP